MQNQVQAKREEKDNNELESILDRKLVAQFKQNKKKLKKEKKEKRTKKPKSK